MDIKSFVLKNATGAKEGARALAKVSSEQKNTALVKMADGLRKKDKGAHKRE